MFFSGPWDAVLVSAQTWLGTPELGDLAKRFPIYVSGPQELFARAWMSGIQDYLREPWSAREFFLRLRGPRQTGVSWVVGAGEWTLEGTDLRLNNELIARLSWGESELLRVLVQRRGEPVGREVLGWAADCSGERSVDTMISKLRRRIRSCQRPEDPLPRSVRGLGYVLP